MREGSHAPNADPKRLPRLDWVLNRLKDGINLQLLNISKELEREMDVLSIDPPHIGITCLQVLLELLESLRNHDWKFNRQKGPDQSKNPLKYRNHGNTISKKVNEEKALQVHCHGGILLDMNIFF
jgi:glutamate/tyrosine decarboxylase-like PLP-dependent enzyme